MIKNNKGFALALCLALLPVLLASFLAGYFLIGGVHLELSTKQVCRQDGIATFKQVRPLLTFLLSLNKLATALRIRHAAAVVRLTYCSANPVCLPAAIKEMQQVRRLRSELDIKQKQIIQQANLLLRLQHQKTQWEIRKKINSKTTSVLSVHATETSGTAPKLAVRPLSSGPAPNYEPVPAFTLKQALAHRWQYQLRLAKWIHPLEQKNFKVLKSCAVSLKKESQEWKILEIEAKSSPKFL